MIFVRYSDFLVLNIFSFLVHFNCLFMYFIFLFFPWFLLSVIYTSQNFSTSPYPHIERFTISVVDLESILYMYTYIGISVITEALHLPDNIKLVTTRHIKSKCAISCNIFSNEYLFNTECTEMFHQSDLSILACIY